MQKRSKNLLSIFGIISLIFGIAVSIPSWVNNNYLGFGISIGLVIIGGILLSIAYG